MDEKSIEFLFDSLISKHIQESFSKGSDVDKASSKVLDDKQFENKLRFLIENNLSVSKVEINNLKENKEFELFNMKLYNSKTKELIEEKTFEPKQNYYYIIKEKEYFFIPSGNFT